MRCAALEPLGLALGGALFVHLYLADMACFGAANAAYARALPARWTPRRARACRRRCRPGPTSPSTCCSRTVRVPSAARWGALPGLPVARPGAHVADGSLSLAGAGKDVHITEWRLAFIAGGGLLVVVRPHLPCRRIILCQCLPACCHWLQAEGDPAVGMS